MLILGIFKKVTRHNQSRTQNIGHPCWTQTPCQGQIFRLIGNRVKFHTLLLINLGHKKIGTFGILEKMASPKNWDFQDFWKMGFSRKLGLTNWDFIRLTFKIVICIKNRVEWYVIDLFMFLSQLTASYRPVTRFHRGQESTFEVKIYSK